MQLELIFQYISFYSNRVKKFESVNRPVYAVAIVCDENEVEGYCFEMQQQLVAAAGCEM